nr:sulfur carrier protein ThiS [Planifilum fimeticola]
MRIRVNGEEMDLPRDVRTVSQLLEHLGVEKRIVVVEQNRRILEREEHDSTPLAEGDSIEIVHFVGGG